MLHLFDIHFVTTFSFSDVKYLVVLHPTYLCKSFLISYKSN